MNNYQLNYTVENKIIQTPKDSKGQGKPSMLQSMVLQSWTQLGD